MRCSEMSTGERGFGNIADEMNKGKEIFSSSIGMSTIYRPNPDFDMNINAVRKQTDQMKNGVRQELNRVR